MEQIKERVVQLLVDSSEQYGETYEHRCVYDNDFDQVAEALVKLFQAHTDVLTTEVCVLREMVEELEVSRNNPVK